MGLGGTSVSLSPTLICYNPAMKIVSWNVNGLRSAHRQGFMDWLEGAAPDILCLQEIKCQEDQLLEGLLRPLGYHAFYNCAAKKGYSGVAVYSRAEPVATHQELGLGRFDFEGRLLRLDFSDFTLLNLYLPQGGRQKENLAYKLAVYERLLGYVSVLPGNVVLAGDFNVAHQEIDLARPRQNRDNIMFTPEERRQLDGLANLGFMDSFRRFHTEAGRYSWLPYIKSARQNNVGWRLDYIWVSRELAPRLTGADIAGDVVMSDHFLVWAELAV